MKRIYFPLAMTLFASTVTAGTDDEPRTHRGNRAETRPLAVGEEAPLFKLKALRGEEVTDLASFRGERPVVLFFGSYT